MTTPPPDPYGAVEQEPALPPEQPTSARPGEPPSPGTEPTRSRLTHEREPRRRIASTVSILALVVSLAGWGWLATTNARDGWWSLGQHVAVEPADDGWASVDTLSVRLTGTEVVDSVDDTEPPAGFRFLVLDLEVRSTEIENSRSCTIEVMDNEGRLFLAGQEVPYADPYVSDLICGTSDPGEDPVPGDQSTLVLVPADAELVSVRISSAEFPAATFVELPLSR